MLNASKAVAASELVSTVTKAPSKSTGPITEQGKAVSSKNAIKAGIFSKAYLPWEDREAKQKEMEDLAREWGVTGPTGMHFLRDIEQANLAQERLMYAERLAVEGAMQSADARGLFAQHADIDVMLARNLPSWFFLQDDGGNKEHAVYLDKVCEQARHLQKHYSDQLVAQAKTRYPELYDYVMEGYTPNSSFVMVLGKQYQKSTPTLNLAALINELSEGHRYHLLWAQDPSRYQIIIDGLRAEKVLSVLDFDRSNRYVTSFQNRRIKAYQGLDLLAQREQSKRLVARTIESSTEKPPLDTLNLNGPVVDEKY